MVEELCYKPEGAGYSSDDAITFFNLPNTPAAPWS
jgi:hypothetical protein